jgi:hypothetical protein
VVVTVGDTGLVPDTFGETVPTPLSMLHEVAFSELHLSVEALPEVMELGSAMRETVGSTGGSVTASVAVSDTVCPYVP